LKAKADAVEADKAADAKMTAKEKKAKLEAKADALPKLNPEEADAANEEKSKAKKAAQAIQDDASKAKKVLEVKTAEADTAKINKESTEEVKKSEKEIEVKKEVKAKKVAQEKPSTEELQKPWGTPSEVWTANMPAHHLEGYAQTGRKGVKEHELAQAKAEEEGNESESENESEDEDSGDESDE